MNIEIFRVFSAMKQAILTNQEILLKLSSIDTRVNTNESDIQELFEALKLLL